HFSPVINLTLPLNIKGKMPCPQSGKKYIQGDMPFFSSDKPDFTIAYQGKNALSPKFKKNTFK
ncbi:hypothetical protein KAU08_07610, partial [bacterium]|nr:hypothetical protein [bacterium]